MHIEIPNLSLIVLIGISGAGKSTFARQHFLLTEVISSDQCRAMVSDDENDLAATKDAFELLHYIAGKRLERGKLTVIDATSVQPEARQPLVALAREHNCLPVAIVLDVDEKICRARNKLRSERDISPQVIHRQYTQLRRRSRRLKKEGFRHIFRLTSVEDIDRAEVVRVPLWNDKSELTGPFDIIGDIHGCYDELVKLLGDLGYEAAGAEEAEGPFYSHPEGRMAIFLGDIVDRGPRVLDCLRLVSNMMAQGAALCVPGNHEVKLLRKLRGKNVQVTHGLAETLAELEALPEAEQEAVKKQLLTFLDSLISHYRLDHGKLVVAHAGLPERFQGRGSARVRQFCLYGETTGETDEFGLPVRHNWAVDYRGDAWVVYGHTPVPEPDWLNRTVNIDTGCVFGGRLTALRYPDKETVSVNAAAVYANPARPFPAQAEHAGTGGLGRRAEVPDAEDVVGKRIISTRLRSNITIREQNGMAALEVMSRFAADPKWLIYLPPTMSPCETSKREGLLEHPEESFAYYRRQGAARVICQEKHMGSRAVVVVCRDEAVATKRFGVEGQGAGIIYTRTGRRFFNDERLETALLDRLRTALDRADFWQELQTDWVCLDCELMPWSEKAQDLLKNQYAAVGAAAGMSLSRAEQMLAATVARDDLQRDFAVQPGASLVEFDPAALLAKVRARRTMIDAYGRAYRHYCWPVDSLEDLKLAPFHVLAIQNRVCSDMSHVEHMELIGKICAQDPDVLLLTEHRITDVTDRESMDETIRWWEEMTARGGEGMVIKPLDFIARGNRGLIQPALKCRGPEYLRIIYGAEYSAPENLERLRARGLSAKRSLALREFALGMESLERFVRREPLRRVHECVFGVLALESEPVDPRL